METTVASSVQRQDLATSRVLILNLLSWTNLRTPTSNSICCHYDSDCLSLRWQAYNSKTVIIKRTRLTSGKVSRRPAHFHFGSANQQQQPWQQCRRDKRYPWQHLCVRFTLPLTSRTFETFGSSVSILSYWFGTAPVAIIMAAPKLFPQIGIRAVLKKTYDRCPMLRLTSLAIHSETARLLSMITSID